MITTARKPASRLIFGSDQASFVIAARSTLVHGARPADFGYARALTAGLGLGLRGKALALLECRDLGHESLVIRQHLLAGC